MSSAHRRAARQETGTFDLREESYFFILRVKLSFIVRQEVGVRHGVFHVGRDLILLLVVNQCTIHLMFFIPNVKIILRFLLIHINIIQP